MQWRQFPFRRMRPELQCPTANREDSHGTPPRDLPTMKPLDLPNTVGNRVTVFLSGLHFWRLIQVGTTGINKTMTICFRRIRLSVRTVRLQRNLLRAWIVYRPYRRRVCTGMVAMFYFAMAVCIGFRVRLILKSGELLARRILGIKALHSEWQTRSFQTGEYTSVSHTSTTNRSTGGTSDACCSCFDSCVRYTMRVGERKHNGKNPAALCTQRT